MDRLQNLKPWAKGISGNPGGRPKRKPLTDAYQAAISNPLPEDLRKVTIARRQIELPEGSTFADLIAIGQCLAAMKGNTAAAEAIANRLEGKVAVELDVVGGASLGERIALARRRLERGLSSDDAQETAEEDRAGGDHQVLT